MKTSLSFYNFFLRILSGIIGGLAGLLSILAVYLVMNLLIQETTLSLSPLVIILMAFLGTITANITTIAVATFQQENRNLNRKRILSHVFSFNVILFLVSLPLYLYAINFDIVITVATLHFLISAFISSLIMTLFKSPENALIGVYGSALGIFASLSIALFTLPTLTNPSIIVFAAIPGTWLLLQLMSSLTEIIYDLYIKFYGVEVFDIHQEISNKEEE